MNVRRGAITLVFDDGYQHIFDTVVPLLDHYRVPAVFSVVLDGRRIAATEGLPVAHWSTWLSLKNRGHEIAAHSVSHVDLTTLAPAQLEVELQAPADKLSAATLVYPGGAYNTAVQAAAARNYQAARTTDFGLEDLRPGNLMALKTVNFTRRNFSLSRANFWALAACAANRWLIETYHIIDNQSSSAKHVVRLSDFTQHLKFITRLPVQIKTIHAHLNHQKRR